MRYVELRSERGDWLVVDTKSIPFRVICTCVGYDAPFNCKEIIEALEHYHNYLYNKFSPEGVKSDG